MKTIAKTKFEVVQGYPYRTDGGEHATSENGQCIIGPDGTTCLGEIIATAPFVELVINTLNNKHADCSFTGVRVELQVATKQVSFYFDANACDDYGDGPEGVKVVFTQQIVDKILGLQSIVEIHSLSELRTYDSPDMWLPEGIEDELRLSCPEMVVGKYDFWFTDIPKHGNYSIENESYPIAELARAFEESPDGGTVFAGESEFLQDLQSHLNDQSLP